MAPRQPHIPNTITPTPTRRTHKSNRPRTLHTTNFPTKRKPPRRGITNATNQPTPTHRNILQTMRRNPNQLQPQLPRRHQSTPQTLPTQTPRKPQPNDPNPMATTKRINHATNHSRMQNLRKTLRRKRPNPGRPNRNKPREPPKTHNPTYHNKTHHGRTWR